MRSRLWFLRMAICIAALACVFAAPQVALAECGAPGCNCGEGECDCEPAVPCQCNFQETCDCADRGECEGGGTECGGGPATCTCSDWCDCPQYCPSAQEPCLGQLSPSCDCGGETCPGIGEPCGETCTNYTPPQPCTQIERQCACGGQSCPNDSVEPNACHKWWCSEGSAPPEEPWTGGCGGAVGCNTGGCALPNCFCLGPLCPHAAETPCLGQQNPCGCGGLGCETVTPPACGWECGPCECAGYEEECLCEGETVKHCVDHCGEPPCGDKVDCVCGGLVCVYIDDNNTPENPNDDREGRFCEKHCSRATDDAARRPCGGKTPCDCGCCCLDDPGASCCGELECTTEVCKRAAAQE